MTNTATAKTKWTRHNPSKYAVFYTSECGRGVITKYPHFFRLLIDGKRFMEDTLPGCKEIFDDFINDVQ
jgi:hypothetical protein